MSGQATLVTGVELVKTDRVTFDRETIFEVKIQGQVVGTVHRHTETIQILAKNANYAIGTRTRRGWTWEMTNSVARELGAGRYRRAVMLETSKTRAANALAAVYVAWKKN